MNQETGDYSSPEDKLRQLYDKAVRDYSDARDKMHNYHDVDSELKGILLDLASGRSINSERFINTRQNMKQGLVALNDYIAKSTRLRAFREAYLECFDIDVMEKEANAAQFIEDEKRAFSSLVTIVLSIHNLDVLKGQVKTS